MKEMEMMLLMMTTWRRHEIKPTARVCVASISSVLSAEWRRRDVIVTIMSRYVFCITAKGTEILCVFGVSFNKSCSCNYSCIHTHAYTRG